MTRNHGTGAPSIHEVLGARVRELRIERGWSQGELGERVTALGPALQQATVSRLEAGTRGVSLDLLLALALVLDAAPLALLLPDDGAGAVELLPGASVEMVDDVWRWLVGHRQLPDRDAQRYVTSLPEIARTDRALIARAAQTVAETELGDRP